MLIKTRYGPTHITLLTIILVKIAKLKCISYHRESTLLKIITLEILNSIKTYLTQMTRIGHPIKLWNVLEKGDDDGGHITYDSLRGEPSWPRSTQL